MKRDVTITINGVEYSGNIPIRMLLVDFIRDVAGLTGTHVGCTFEGQCGACTIHLNGEAVKSCLLLAVQCHGKEITTVEGLAREGALHVLQEEFHRHHALQCGYCTSGMLMNAAEFITERPDADDEEIRHALVGNICRCTGYTNIIKAISAAAKRNASV
ncbi:MAG: carbon monoxide dehydrogenase [Rhizobiales bacterium]|nr:carbon monoxide dehydrogenase [Hyphomicrobiales bacterium]MBA68334.1 carbon monoxide dehydrogenase [Hyphomicrobiales bacterium]|tara:strand:+ start:544 stop:1020 length:477 start_codon:yes stop_codon:yes gene_type:complete